MFGVPRGGPGGSALFAFRGDSEQPRRFFDDDYVAVFMNDSKLEVDGGRTAALVHVHVDDVAGNKPVIVARYRFLINEDRAETQVLFHGSALDVRPSLEEVHQERCGGVDDEGV